MRSSQKKSRGQGKLKFDLFGFAIELLDTRVRGVIEGGFTLREIRELLKLDAGQNRSRARELAKSRVEALDAKIVELGRARDALQQLAAEYCAGDKGPCPTLASFDV
ncbi:MerR family DNA-binding protein [Sphingobium sp. SCG-1]|uniref:MerR family DNA-binding protein n=1 Tax=Sphingobium sp. SCG-1 TaxID=2072936 RepID=UPI001CB9B91A|nr:MerR family DNA-binding protein [Sphingobium sp. SCG-1]